MTAKADWKEVVQELKNIDKQMVRIYAHMDRLMNK